MVLVPHGIRIVSQPCSAKKAAVVVVYFFLDMAAFPYFLRVLFLIQPVSCLVFCIVFFDLQCPLKIPSQDCPVMRECFGI